MLLYSLFFVFFFSSRRRHTRCLSDWSSDVCSSDLDKAGGLNHEEVEELGGFIARLRDDLKTTVLLVEHHMGLVRSEERRVGKECRSRWSADHKKQKKDNTRMHNRHCKREEEENGDA